MTCPHETFESSVTVNRLVDAGAFVADIHIRCDQCQEAFVFVGPAVGLDGRQPMVSPDRQELRAPITPASGGPLMQMGFRVSESHPQDELQ